jgi:hypothetical protein
MCEFSENHRKRDSVNYFIGQPNTVMARAVLERFPYAFRKGRCPRCGKPLQFWEQRPQGRATRCMCTQDYDWIVPKSVGSDKCIVCGGNLPDHKVRAQYRNPREISEHIHDGECMHLWSIVHNFSIGEPDVVEMLCRRFNGFDAHHDRLDNTHSWDYPHLPPPQKQKFLPFPQNQLRYEPSEKNVPQRVLARLEYKGKPIRNI